MRSLNVNSNVFTAISLENKCSQFSLQWKYAKFEIYLKYWFMLISVNISRPINESKNSSANWRPWRSNWKRPKPAQSLPRKPSRSSRRRSTGSKVRIAKYISFVLLSHGQCAKKTGMKIKSSYVSLSQMNWASTRTDTSRWPMKWTRRSPNWQDIRLLYYLAMLRVPNNCFNLLVEKSTFYVCANNVTARRCRSTKKREITKGYAVNIIYYSRSLFL